MRALFMKDLRAFIDVFLLGLVMMFLYSFLIYKTGSFDGLVGFLVVYVPSIIGVVLFLGDNELIKHNAAMPIKREALVISKYLSTYVFGFAMVALTILITGGFVLFMGAAKLDFSKLLTLPGILFAILPVSFIVSLSYPLLFKFGLQLGVKIVLGFFALFYGVGALLVERLVQKNLYVSNDGIFAAAMSLMKYYEEKAGALLFYGLLIALLVLIIFGSVLLSIHWIRKKDFE